MYHEGKEYYHLKVAAEGTGYKESTLLNYFHTGKIKGHKINGELYFTADDIAAIHHLKESGGVRQEAKEPAIQPAPVPDKKENVTELPPANPVIPTGPDHRHNLKRSITISPENEKHFECIKTMAAAKRMTVGDYLIEQGMKHVSQNIDHLKAIRSS